MYFVIDVYLRYPLYHTLSRFLPLHVLTTASLCRYHRPLDRFRKSRAETSSGMYLRGLIPSSTNFPGQPSAIVMDRRVNAAEETIPTRRILMEVDLTDESSRRKYVHLDIPIRPMRPYFIFNSSSFLHQLHLYVLVCLLIVNL